MEKEREPKTTVEQWRVILEYMEQYPALLKNKFNSSYGDMEQHKRLWQDLAVHLNSMGLGSRSVAKWQLAIGRWKSKTKAKASALKIEAGRTGGGPLNTPPLSNIEQRLMSLLGSKCVTGDCNKELGISNLMIPIQNASDLGVQLTTIALNQKECQQWTENMQFAGYQKDPPPLLPFTIESKVGKEQQIEKEKKHLLENPDSSAPPSKRKVRTTGDRTRRFVNMAKMHNEMIEKLTNIEKNTGAIASAISEVSKDFKMYLKHIIQSPPDDSKF